MSSQIVEISSSEDEEEDEEQPREFATTAVASAQEEEIQTQGPIDTTIEPTVPTPPTMDMPAPPIAETSIIESTLSQTYIEHQMKQMTDSITTSIGSMFDKFHQSMEQRF